MTFLKFNLLASAAVTVAACLSAQAGMALPSGQTSLMAQVNVPSQEGVPPLATEEVRGRITSIEGDKVTIRTSAGETKTYDISASEQERNRLTVGSEVMLTVRGESVVAIGPAGGEMRSGTTTSGSSSSSSSSSTVIRRETTVQQTRPAPAPAPAARPAPAPAPAAQPVRGLW